MRTIVVLVLLLSSIACTNSRVVKPLHTGQLEAGLDVGGPIFRFGDNFIPMPLSSLSASYGLKPDLTLYGGWHTTAAAYGVAQIDLGVLKEILPPDGMLPGVSFAPALNLMVDRWEFAYAAYPSIDMNLYWLAFEGPDYFYVGMANWFELRQARAHGEDQPTHWVPALHAGYSWLPGRLRLTAEAKYLAPFSSNKNIAVEYLGPLDYGTLGIYLSMGYRF
ncbi:MAG: hypothetical protein OEZ43_03775 [Gammaproteobacteria bacterium]|nr:hypothetical protein [Gammaproteobacteria bacterium]